MSNDKCGGEKYSCFTVSVGRKGKPRMAFEQGPEGSERVPYGYWGKLIPDRIASQVPEREASLASLAWSSEPSKQREEDSDRRWGIGDAGQVGLVDKVLGFLGVN